MSSRLTPWTRAAARSGLVAALLASATLALGCHERQTGTAAAPAPAAPTASVAAPSAHAVRVEVEMTDRGVNMPGNLMPGPTLFLIHNSGKTEHRLALERGDQVSRLDSALAPGERGQLEVNLEPGSYRVFCTYREHPELPRQLVVTDRATR